MKQETENRICQNCKKDFAIEVDDFSFYEKIPRIPRKNRSCENWGTKGQKTYPQKTGYC